MTPLDQVFARPDDLALRAVVADALHAQSNPWGEFIALQLALAHQPGTTARRARVRELLAKHVALFAGPIATVASTLERKHCLLFERGFLAQVELDRRQVPRTAWLAAARAPHWATVREARFSVLTTPTWWVAHWAKKNPAALRSLVSLNVSNALVLERASPADAWVVVRCLRATRYAGLLAAFAQCSAPIEPGPRLPKSQQAWVRQALGD